MYKIFIQTILYMSITFYLRESDKKNLVYNITKYTSVPFSEVLRYQDARVCSNKY